MNTRGINTPIYVAGLDGLSDPRAAVYADAIHTGESAPLAAVLPTRVLLLNSAFIDRLHACGLG